MVKVPRSRWLDEDIEEEPEEPLNKVTFLSQHNASACEPFETKERCLRGGFDEKSACVWIQKLFTSSSDDVLLLHLTHSADNFLIESPCL